MLSRWVAEKEAYLQTRESINSVSEAQTQLTLLEASEKEKVSVAGPAAMRSISKLSYTSAYICSYGVTYAAVFLANALPSENAVMRGFTDGAHAAMDALETK